MAPFNCRHDRTPENSRGTGRYKRCRQCDNAKRRERNLNKPPRYRPDPKKANCAKCETPISTKNKTGMCRPCIANDPEQQAKRKIAQRRRYDLDPTLGEAAAARLRAVTSTPEHAERGRAMMLANRVWEKSPPLVAGSERAKEAGRRVSAARMAWCPPHLRATYHALMRKDGIRAEEARRLILDQNAVDLARWRAKHGIIVTGKELPPLASVSQHIAPARRVLERAAQVFSVTVEEIKSADRAQKFLRPRAAVAHVLHGHGWTSPRIARFLGKEDHTTALNWLKRAEQLLTNEEFDCAVEELEEAWSFQLPEAMAA